MPCAGAGAERTPAATAGAAAGFRSRVVRLRATHSYGAVLALIGASFVFASVSGDAPWTAGVLLLLAALTLAVAVWTSGIARVTSSAGLGILGVAVTTAVAAAASDSAWVAVAAGALSATFVVATVAAIAVGVLDQNDVNARSIAGAVCIYLLFGLLFLFVYSAAALAASGPFFAQGTDGTRSLRLYFSFVTLATLGYGDYTPAAGAGRTLAVLESLLGQLYLVTVLALLVSRLRRRHDPAA